MLWVKRIVLSDGQSYEGVGIYEAQDFEKNSVEAIFDHHTIAFFYENSILYIHSWNVKLIHLYDAVVKTPNCKRASRLVISGNVIFEDVKILDTDAYLNAGIPFIIRRGDDDPSSQMVFCAIEGTFIIGVNDIVSLVMPFEKKGVAPCANSAGEGCIIQGLKSTRSTKTSKVYGLNGPRQTR